MARTTERKKAGNQGWSPEIAGLIKWFLGTPPSLDPFMLYQGVRVSRPLDFWQCLKGDIAGGPAVARARSGAFQKDLRRLAELFGSPSTATTPHGER